MFNTDILSLIDTNNNLNNNLLQIKDIKDNDVLFVYHFKAEI